jgi:hypothetical protein
VDVEARGSGRGEGLGGGMGGWGAEGLVGAEVKMKRLLVCIEALLHTVNTVWMCV